MRDVLERTIRVWLEDPESSVVYAEEVDGRWAVRMAQQARDFTTVWFDVGERSLRYEAYVIPDVGPAAHHLVLLRNMRSWRVFFAIDHEDSILLRGRLPADRVTHGELDLVLGEIYDTVETTFPLLVEIAKSGVRKL
ncbi:MAG: YbjN domain-containing protein [Actinobacteria bacterium]|nr:YbjN domain-containing protein [Actinomycetota bacterium]MCI0544836.1 YbjN domain-containing protein [Actinomycetota bacterium]MCI0678580.1 YbjN domain-containing protein [Actinomycetota bacterium]